ncbi:MFS transporter [Myxococcus sp. AM011]|uniref:MFS transporter n=1 Tax=Myxococcus sp. AM011 TaxID=2745200 RepID=UPI001595C36C|nr:MFS transporter [Myxococcus sp. AM011]NVJ24030.1 MFS transporter [Myxococcus sp. AM011]
MSPSSSDAAAWRSILTISFLVGMFAVAVGGTPVLLGVLLSRQGVADSVIGISAACSPLGLIASSFVIPWAAERFGAVRIGVASCMLGLTAMASMALVPEPLLWIAARLLWGLAVGGFYIVNKAWLAQLTPSGRRGRVFGIYTSCLSAGFACGPLLVSLADFRSPHCFAMLGAAFVACATGVLLVSKQLPDFHGTARAPVLGAVPLIPAALLAAASFGAFDHASLAFLPRFGAVHGTSTAFMGIGLSVLNVGNVLLQPPIGWVSDRWGRRPVMVGCALLTVLGGGALPWVIGASTPLLYLFLFVWGACAYGTTTVALASIGDRFTGAQLLSCSAAMTMAGGVGGVAGSSAIGVLQDAFGIQAFPRALILIFLALAVVAARSMRDSSPDALTDAATSR